MMFSKKVLFAFGSCIRRSGAALVEYSLTITDKFVDVTSADGKNISRYGSLVNDQLPGPILRAKEGDQFLIYVTNNQASRNAALHWHGLTQPGTPYYDGVPGVSQCGIPSGETAVYNFTASPVGTYCELVVREMLFWIPSSIVL
jgi:FtsP/CotA-like multicopper oxidase with cupredoxin domain